MIYIPGIVGAARMQMRFPALTCACLLLANLIPQSRATHFDFSYHFFEVEYAANLTGDALVTGSFEGRMKEGYVYDITNIKMAFNGVEFERPFYLIHPFSPEPIVSVEMWRNNFAFVDNLDYGLSNLGTSLYQANGY